MKVSIKINMDNAAFKENENGIELHRILSHAAEKIQGNEWHIGDRIFLLDINGNDVGSINFRK